MESRLDTKVTCEETETPFTHLAPVEEIVLKDKPT